MTAFVRNAIQASVGTERLSSLEMKWGQFTLLNYHLFVTAPNVHEEVYRKNRTGIDLEQSPDAIGLSADEIGRMVSNVCGYARRHDFLYAYAR